ncbi:MAG TPA: heme A synthase [Alphaproteobacteria bacterium]|nr:heme A synthase [Alphaproteobacteria bacterium]HAJ47915.1 heme A synthase [Alphaproteobacteria bacterium]
MTGRALDQSSPRKWVALWLFSVAGLVALMVVVGGLTRLTDSGLSITSWKPIHGALPPLSLAEWEDEFEAYRQIPEYQKINKGMSLEEFKTIFWWEWGHRNLGRLIGLAYALPLLVFWWRGQIASAWWPWLLGLLFLGGLQGFVGWWMVASGLTERTDVSQYRLVTHLTLALVIFCGLLWMAYRVLGFEAAQSMRALAQRNWVFGFLALVFVQIMLGGLVAGTDAGMTYNTWPLMDGKVIPDGLWAQAPWWLNPFENITQIQFNHRLGGYAVAIAAVLLWWRIRKARDQRASRLADIMLATVGAQVLIGIATLIAVMPVWLAAMHQFGAVLVLAATVTLAAALAPVHSTQKPIS